MVYNTTTFHDNEDEGQSQEQTLGHEDPIVRGQHHDGHFQHPPNLSNSDMKTQMWEGVQHLQNRMQGMEDMQGRV